MEGATMSTMEITPIPWTQFTAAFLSLYDPPMRSRNTRGEMRRALALFEALGVKTRDQVTRHLSAAWWHPGPLASPVTRRPGYLPGSARRLATPKQPAIGASAPSGQ